MLVLQSHMHVQGFALVASLAQGGLTVEVPLLVNDTTYQLEAQAALNIAGSYELEVICVYFVITV